MPLLAPVLVGQVLSEGPCVSVTGGWCAATVTCTAETNDTTAYSRIRQIPGMGPVETGDVHEVQEVCHNHSLELPSVHSDLDNWCLFHAGLHGTKGRESPWAWLSPKTAPGPGLMDPKRTIVVSIPTCPTSLAQGWTRPWPGRRGLATRRRTTTSSTTSSALPRCHRRGRPRSHLQGHLHRPPRRPLRSRLRRPPRSRLRSRLFRHLRSRPQIHPRLCPRRPWRTKRWHRCRRRQRKQKRPIHTCIGPSRR